MIAWAGAERLALGLTDTLDAMAHARWPLSEVRGASRPDAAQESRHRRPA
jgi:N6-L-threonylcarbamoyladenine synthase